MLVLVKYPTPETDTTVRLLAGVFKLKSVKQRMEIFAVTNAGLAIPFGGMSHYSIGRMTIAYRSPLEVRKGRTRSTSALKNR